MSNNTQPITVEFVDDLPPRVGGPGLPQVYLTQTLAPLMAESKRWGIIARSDKKSNQIASRYRNSAKRPHNAGHRWEFATREGAVYARYLGPAE